MQLTIHFVTDSDQYSADASLSIGWITLSAKDVEISFFRERGCMIFLNLTTLLEIVKDLNPGRVSEWIGEDNGSIVRISLVKNELCFESGLVRLFVPLGEFKRTVKHDLTNFLKKCVSINRDIERESAFIDLVTTVDKFE